MRTFVLAFATLLLPLRSAPQTNAALPADKRAFSAAMSLQDPQQRLDALKSFQVRYPASSSIDHAQEAVLKLLLEHFPTRSADTQRQIELMVRTSPREELSYTQAYLASTLADSDLDLPIAEKLVSKRLSQRSFFASQQKIYKKHKYPVPSDSDLLAQYKGYRAYQSAVLGSVYFQEGKVSAAQPLLRQACADDPDNTRAPAYLGLIAAHDGRRQEALTYLTRAKLAGKLTERQQAEFETLYKQVSPAPTQPLQAYLDEQYEKLFPAPFKPSKYQPPTKPSGRTVLLELFTGSGCSPCVGADLAMDGQLERYSRNEYALLTFHEHIPEPDPLANPATERRLGFYDVQHTPTFVIDGIVQRAAGGGRANAKERFDLVNKAVEQDLERTPEAVIRLTAESDHDGVHVRASATDVHSDAKSLNLVIALAENRVTYSGENGIRFHHMVVRSMTPGDGLSLTLGQTGAVDYTFKFANINAELKAYLDHFERSNTRFGPITFSQKLDTINPADLAVVAFVQDTASKHVLQAAYALVSNGYR